jgi:hypothetical protein
LRGLIALWQNQIDKKPMIRPQVIHSSTNNKQVVGERNPQCSKAFPENLLSLVPSRDPIPYGVIEGMSATSLKIPRNKRKRENDDILLPDLDETTTITFLLSTNAKRLKLGLGEIIPNIVTITETNLNEDMEIIVHKLQVRDRSHWTQFVEDRVRSNVKLKFLFTI